MCYLCYCLFGTTPFYIHCCHFLLVNHQHLVLMYNVSSLVAEAQQWLNVRHNILQWAIRHYLNPKQNKEVNIIYDNKNTKHNRIPYMHRGRKINYFLHLSFCLVQNRFVFLLSASNKTSQLSVSFNLYNKEWSIRVWLHFTVLFYFHANKSIIKYNTKCDHILHFGEICL